MFSKKLKLSILTFGLISTFNCVNAFVSIRVESYDLIRTNPDYNTNKLSPRAYKIYGAKSEYGFNDGTIFYRQTFRDVTYYSPVPPSYAEEALKNILIGDFGILNLIEVLHEEVYLDLISITKL